MEIKWSDQLSIDGGLLDEEHKAMIQKTNMFLKMGKTFDSADQARQFLIGLKEHLAIHTAHEEEYLQQIDFPDLQQHSKSHEKLNVEMDALLQVLDRVKFYDLTEINRRTAHFFSHFLVGHFLNEDMKMKAYSAAHRKAQDAEQDPEHDITYI